MKVDSCREHCQHRLTHDPWVSLPLNHVSASEVDDASKYKIALLSTSLSTIPRKSHQPTGQQIKDMKSDSPFPCTILAGCGNVCILNTAHRSTNEFGSFPSLGSLHSTIKSLHKMPTNALGVCSGLKQSTCTFDASPWLSISSNAIVAFRTTRVRSKGPSMMNRRWGWTSGEGNRPRIRACHWTSLRRDSDSRLPSFMFVASEDISVTALSRGSMYSELPGGVARPSSSNFIDTAQPLDISQQPFSTNIDHKDSPVADTAVSSARATTNTPPSSTANASDSAYTSSRTTLFVSSGSKTAGGSVLSNPV